jgi:hypothetical protein
MMASGFEFVCDGCDEIYQVSEQRIINYVYRGTQVKMCICRSCHDANVIGGEWFSDEEIEALKAHQRFCDENPYECM